MNNNNDKVRNDFLFFQNEILTDVKKFETRLNEKIAQTTDFIDQQNQKIETKFKEINSRIESLLNQIQEKDSSLKFETLLQQIKHKNEENISKIEIKLNLLDRDLNDACFKYDKVISNNLKVPGLIGSSCPYDSLRPFLEFINRKLSELLKSNDKQILDLKKYKEKMESIIGQNKTQIETVQNKFNEYCTNLFKQSDVNCIDRISVIEKRIEALRMENGKYACELQERSKELQIEWDKLDNFEKSMNKRYSEEVEKYKILID
jgi:DNA repair exonuclease SbcCD ATPase subunit